MQTVNYPIDKLIFAEYNPRQLTKDQYKDLKDSITRFGLVDPMIVNTHKQRKNILVGGHQRVRVAKDLGFEEVPCVEVKLTLDKEKELNIRLNKNTGEWDYDALANYFDVGELTEWGFTEDDLQFWADEPTEGLIDDDEVPEVEEAITQSGDMWMLGDHKVLCGDATKKEDVERLMDGQKADMVFTDPPYNVNYEYESYDDNKTDEVYLDFVEQFYYGIKNNIKVGGVVYVMSGDKYLIDLGILFKKHFRFSQILLWIKDNPTLGNSDYQYNYEAILYGWDLNGTHKYYGDSVVPAANYVERDRGAVKTIHKAQRPIKLVCDYVQNSSKSNQMILDLFLGSGSTLIACEKTNRKCYGMEIDPHYCDVIVKRWEEYTGKKAERTERVQS